MIDSEKVIELVSQALEDQKAFLVNLHLGTDDKIKIIADHHEGMSLERLKRISRMVDKGLGDEHPYEIEVSSPGLGQPLLVKEQYVKNVGHPVKVKLKDERIIIGDYTNFEDDILTIQWEERVPKQQGKGKETVIKEEKIPLSDIEETRIEIRF